MNDDILPIGYKAHRVDRNYWMTPEDNWRQAGLLLVIVIIYSLCAVIFESLRKPFVILLMHGNVREWCDGGILRSGSWRNYSYQCRSASVLDMSRELYDKTPSAGFRVIFPD